VVGVAVLAQIVAGVCAASFPVQAKRKVNIARDPLVYLKYLGLEIGVLALARQNCSRAGHKNKNRSLKDRTTTPLKKVICGGYRE